MIIAMVAVRVMKMSLHQVVHMIAMRHSFVATSRSMRMALVVCAAAMLGCAPVGICWRHFNLMFVDVIAMYMMQMPVVQVVNVAFVADSRVTAIGSVKVRMTTMLRIGASCHDRSPAVVPMLHRILGG